MSQAAIYRWRELPLLLAVAVLYFLISLATNDFFLTVGMPIATVRPNAGFALGVVLILGMRFLPAIFVGCLASWLLLGYSLIDASAIAAGVSGGAALGLWLLTRNGRFDAAIPSIRAYVRFVILAAVVSVGVAAVVGSLAMFHHGSSAALQGMILRWWMGDVLGVVLVGPLLLMWRQLPRHWLQRRTTIELVAFFVVSFLVGQTVFLDWFHESLGSIARGYWMFLFVVWGAVRLGAQSVVLVLCMTTVQALLGAAAGKGFFGTDIAQTHLINFWFYMLILSIVGMGLAAEVTAFRRAEAKIRDVAHHDGLTGLANRLLLTDRIQQAIAAARREGRRLGIIFHDLDRFKPVNDNYGHQKGDQLLSEVAKRVKDCVRESDTVARIGGDEFVILLPSIEATQDIVTVAEKIQKALAQPFVIGGDTISISTSVGIAIYPEHGLDEPALLINADNAMYMAKQRGRNNVVIYSSDMPRVDRSA